jgi:hypothetical protein
MQVDGNPRLSRRQFLKAGAGLGLASTAALAGCFYYVPSGPRGGGGGGGGLGTTPGRAGEQFYTNGPPSRNGPQIHADDYGSLQAAHDDTPEGGTLLLSAGQTYRERFDISTDHITIASADSTNPTTIEQPDNSENWAIQSDHTSISYDAELAAAVTPGDQQISVTDTSSFSPGDDIAIRVDQKPYGEAESGGYQGAGYTREYRTVTEIPDGRTLVLNRPMLLPFPMDSATGVGTVEWSAQDVRITDLTIQGTSNTREGPDASRPVKLYGIRDGWFDNIEVTGGGRYSFGLGDSYHCRLDNITCRDGLRYGTNIHHGFSGIYATNIRGENLRRYALRFGPDSGGPSSTMGRGESVSGTGMDGNFVANAHHGAFHVSFADVNSVADRILRLRSRYISLDGFTSDSNSSYDFRLAQRPYHCEVRNGEVINKPDGGGDVFTFYLEPGRNTRADDILFENIRIEPYGGRSAADIGDFYSGAIIDGLTFRNVTYGGERLTREHVEQWDGYGSADITGLVVE